MHALDQPIGHDTTCEAEDAPLRATVILAVFSEAQPTWGIWFDVANGLLVFMERYEYVEFTYKVRKDEGVVVGVGELADFP